MSKNPLQSQFLFPTVALVSLVIGSYYLRISTFSVQPSAIPVFPKDRLPFPTANHSQLPASHVTDHMTDHMIQEDVFGQWKAVKLKEVDKPVDKAKKEPSKYAVISSSTPRNLSNVNDYNYAFDLPLTVVSWQRLGFKSIVLLTGSTDVWVEHSILGLIHSYLKDLGAKIVFIEGNDKNKVMLSQTSRLFAACLSDLDLDDYIITSDSDLWPINGEKFVLPKNKELLSTYAECCSDFRHKGEKFRMLPLSSIGATVKTWRDIMFNDNNSTCSFDAIKNSSNILSYFAKEFGKIVFEPVSKGVNDGWYLDQHMASIRIEQWIRRRNDTSMLEFATRDIKRDRLDRSRWHPRNLRSLTDTHLLTSLYKTGAWLKLQPVLTAMYGKGSTFFTLCQRYRQEFVAEVQAKLKVLL